MRKAVLALVVWLVLGAAAVQAAEGPASFTLWQLPSQTSGQMMSYVLRTPGGHVLVIDGGRKEDSPYLRGFLGALGNSVEAWFITHPHNDHVEALLEILDNPQGLAIDTIYASLPEEAWADEYASDRRDLECIRRSHAHFNPQERSFCDLTLGQQFTFDGVQVQVLGIRNPEITKNCINNSSVVLKVWDAHKSVLFLADLGFEGGEKLLHGPYADQLHTDYLQMAHHGQQGVGEAVYQAIRPRDCLWPTTQWLWDNDPSHGKDPNAKGTGRWKTLETRAWMEKLPIQHHYLSADGLQRID